MKQLYTLLLLSFVLNLSAQSKRVLFIGNSFTSVNNLPKMAADVAASAGDVLYYDSNTIGGAHLNDHFYNAVTLSKIQAGHWDYVVLQDQSESYFAFPSDPLTYQFFAAAKLDSIIKQYNPCAQTVFYITWGYKSGDGILCGLPDCIPPVVVTYDYFGMDSLIETNYMRVADSLRAMASPVGKVWRYTRRSDTLLEMFSTDGYHPSVAGTYAAACCFYTTLLRKDPTLITFNSTLMPADAALIKTAAKLNVYDSLSNWNIGTFDSLLPSSCFSGIPEMEPRLGWDIYPNPADAVLNINLEYTSRNETIQLFNVQGIQVASQTISQSATQIDIADLPAGLYFVQSKDHPRKVLKLVKQ